MDEIKKSEELDLETIRRKAYEDGILDESDERDSAIVGNNWMNNVPVGPPVDIVEEPKEVINEVELPKEEYQGSGVVVNNEDIDKNSQPEEVKFTGVSAYTQEYFDNYLSEMDADIEALKKEKEEFEAQQESKKEEPEVDEDGNPIMTEDEFEKEYNEAVVIIDKTGFGSIINFTDEEREKLEKSKKIKLEEIENIELESITIKKKKKGKNIDSLIKNVTSTYNANIVLPASGYIAVMKGCSAHELIQLINDGNNIQVNLQNKWSLIYDKIESTSLGKMTYDEFLLNTASIDINNFIYGILCATYPDNDTVQLTCPKCKTEYDHSYSIKSLIRAEKMSERLTDLFMGSVDNSYSSDSAKFYHKGSPVSTVKKIKLPVSGIIIDVYTQNAYDLINKSAKELAQENRESKYQEASIMSTGIDKLYLPDNESNDGSYYEIDSAMDIVKCVYSLGDVDNEILIKVINDVLEGLTVEFGLMNVKCPKCNHYIPSITMDIENILFLKYQQARNTIVE